MTFLPKLYYVGQKGTIFTWTNYFIFVLTGLAHSVIVFVIPYYVYLGTVINKSGTTADMWIFSVTSFTSVIFVRIQLLTFLIDCYWKIDSFYEIFLCRKHGSYHPIVSINLLCFYLDSKSNQIFIHLLNYSLTTYHTLILPYSFPMRRFLLYGRIILYWLQI